MTFIDQDGIKKETLLEYGISTITSFKIQCYWFTFGFMKDVDVISIILKVQQYYDQKLFNQKEFINFLRVRKIPFKLKWIPCLERTFRENLLHFLFITRCNLKTK